MNYDIEEEIGCFSSGGYSQEKRLNIISWNEKEPKIDIRIWSGDKPLKGICMTRSEAEALNKLLSDYLES